MVRLIMSSGCLPLAARTVAWASRNSPTGRSERNVVCCVISAMGFLDGSLRYSRGGRSPLIRIRRSDGVSASANISTSLISVVLPDPVGPTMLATLPIFSWTRSTGSGSPSFPRPPMIVMLSIWLIRSSSVVVVGGI